MVEKNIRLIDVIANFLTLNAEIFYENVRIGVKICVHKYFTRCDDCNRIQPAVIFFK
jgi:hypothetical protein